MKKNLKVFSRRLSYLKCLLINLIILKMKINMITILIIKILELIEVDKIELVERIQKMLYHQ